MSAGQHPPMKPGISIEGVDGTSMLISSAALFELRREICSFCTGRATGLVCEKCLGTLLHDRGLKPLDKTNAKE